MKRTTSAAVVLGFALALCAVSAPQPAEAVAQIGRLLAQYEHELAAHAADLPEADQAEGEPGERQPAHLTVGEAAVVQRVRCRTTQRS